MIVEIADADKAQAAGGTDMWPAVCVRALVVHLEVALRRKPRSAHTTHVRLFTRVHPAQHKNPHMFRIQRQRDKHRQGRGNARLDTRAET